MARTKKVNPDQILTGQDKIKYDINQLCFKVGDTEFLIRQKKSEIQSFYVQIDKLRNDLATLQVKEANGSQDTK